MLDFFIGTLLVVWVVVTVLITPVCDWLIDRALGATKSDYIDIGLWGVLTGFVALFLSVHVVAKYELSPLLVLPMTTVMTPVFAYTPHAALALLMFSVIAVGHSFCLIGYWRALRRYRRTGEGTPPKRPTWESWY